MLRGGWKRSTIRTCWSQADPLASMAGNLGRYHDYPPTTRQITVHKKFQQWLADYLGQFKTVREKDTPAFNATLKSNGFAAAIQP